MNRTYFVALCLFLLMFATCTAVPDPTPTPENIAADVATLPAPRPSTTPTSIPPTVTATEVLETATAVIPTSTNIPLPSATPITLPSLSWANIPEEVSLINGRLLSWSPVSNQYAFSDCPTSRKAININTIGQIFVAEAPSFQATEITPDDILCRTVNASWYPQGHALLLSAMKNDSELILRNHNTIWSINFEDQTTKQLEIYGEWLVLAGWQDEHKAIYQSYAKGGHFNIGFFDATTGEHLTAGLVHIGDVNEINSDFVITESGMYQYYQHGVVVFSAEKFEHAFTRDIREPYTIMLAYDNQLPSRKLELSSRFQALLPGTNQILVQTWDVTQPLLKNDMLNGNVQSNLQLWDVDTDQLTLVVNDGIFGRFSPDGSYLIFMTASEFPLLHFYDRATEQTVFSQSAYAEVDEDSSKVTSYISFSPNGRILTFYSPTPELMLYDLESGEFLPPLTAVPFTPLWSPDSSRFVYDDPNNGLSIFDMRSQTDYPLATSGGARLSNPQWSYDGTYLSVAVLQADGERDTAVLQLP